MSERTSTVAQLRRCWQLLSRRRRRQAGLLLLLMIISTIVEVASVGAVLPFLGVLIDPARVFNHPIAAPVIALLGVSSPSELVWPVTVIFCAAAVLAMTVRQALILAQVRFGAALAIEFSVSAYRKTLFQSYAVHVARNSSDVIAGVSKAGDIGATLVTPFLLMASSAFLIMTILGMLIWIRPMLALGLFFGFGLIYTAVTLLTRRMLASEGAVISADSGRMIKALQEGLGGIRDVLIDGSQAAYVALYQGAAARMQRSSANIQIIGQSPRYLVEGVGTVLIAVVAFIIARGSGGLNDAIPILGGLAMGSQRILPAMQLAYSSITYLQARAPIIADGLDLLEQPLPPQALLPPAEPIPFESELRFRSVSFRYAPTLPDVLDGIDLEIRKGEMIGLIGSTGSGKSTLIDLVMGLIEPSSGQILIDGVPLDSETRRGWQRHIAHVPQSIFLADATIAENIALGQELSQIDFRRVKEAAQRAQIANAIESWKNGYDTVVGERGVRLSGGQRQRIGIARALYRNADVIILDEATSALDNATESMVMESIEAVGGQATVILIAHRITTLRSCDRIIDLEGGRVRRICTYAQIAEAVSTAAASEAAQSSSAE